MKKLALSAAALVVLSSAALTAAQAAPMFSSLDAPVTSSYTQVDCMERDGGPSGCDSLYSYLDQSHQRTTADQLNGYRAYFNNGGNAPAYPTVTGSHGGNVGPYFTDHESSRE